jgi:hypothetical protein
MLQLSKILNRTSKSVGPLVNVIGYVSDAQLRAATVEIGSPENWQPAKRDKHPKLHEGRSLVLREYNHHDAECRNQFPALESIIEYVLSLGYGSVAGKIVVACLPPGKKILPHRDVGGYYKFHNRIHVPLVTHQDSIMQSVDQLFHMDLGKVYLFQNLEIHSAHNRSNGNRLHLIIDVLDDRYSARIYQRGYLLLASNFLLLGTLYRLWGRWRRYSDSHNQTIGECE